MPKLDIHLKRKMLFDVWDVILSPHETAHNQVCEFCVMSSRHCLIVKINL